MARITLVVDLPEYDETLLDPHDVGLDLLAVVAEDRRAQGEGVLVFIGAEWGDHLPDESTRVND